MVRQALILSCNKATESHLLQYMCTPYPQLLLHPRWNITSTDGDMYLPLLTCFMYAVTGDVHNKSTKGRAVGVKVTQQTEVWTLTSVETRKLESVISWPAQAADRASPLGDPSPLRSVQSPYRTGTQTLPPLISCATEQTRDGVQ